MRFVGREIASEYISRRVGWVGWVLGAQCDMAVLLIALLLLLILLLVLQVNILAGWVGC